MLVLSRRTGETVLFIEDGEAFLKAKLIKVTSSECTFKVTRLQGQPYELNIRRTDSYRLAEDLELYVVAISRGVAKLGFDAPKSVKIMRSELLPLTTI